MSNWYVGQRVVSLRDMPAYGRKRGEVFTIRSIGGCRCGVMLDVGIDTKRNMGCKCSVCRFILPGTAAFGHESGFKPLDALTEAMDRIESEGAPIEEPQPEFA